MKYGNLLKKVSNKWGKKSEYLQADPESEKVLTDQPQTESEGNIVPEETSGAASIPIVTISVVPSESTLTIPEVEEEIAKSQVNTTEHNGARNKIVWGKAFAPKQEVQFDMASRGEYYDDDKSYYSELNEEKFQTPFDKIVKALMSGGQGKQLAQ